MKLRGRIGALHWPRVTGVEETGCSGQNELSFQDGAGRPLGRVDQSVAFPLPGKHHLLWSFFWALQHEYFKILTNFF